MLQLQNSCEPVQISNDSKQDTVEASCKRGQSPLVIQSTLLVPQVIQKKRNKSSPSKYKKTVNRIGFHPLGPLKRNLRALNPKP